MAQITITTFSRAALASNEAHGGAYSRYGTCVTLWYTKGHTLVERRGSGGAEGLPAGPRGGQGTVDGQRRSLSLGADQDAEA